MPESEADAGLLKTFVDHFTFQQLPHSHILCYLIPGAEGQIEPGARRLNWVWYWNVSGAAFSEVITGRDGAVHDFSVPPGQVRSELIKQQNTIAEDMFCPAFLALWQATRKPFGRRLHIGEPGCGRCANAPGKLVTQSQQSTLRRRWKPLIGTSTLEMLIRNVS